MRRNKKKSEDESFLLFWIKLLINKLLNTKALVCVFIFVSHLGPLTGYIIIMSFENGQGTSKILT